MLPLRLRSSDLIGPSLEPGHRVFNLGNDHPLSEQPCAAGCGRPLKDGPTVMVPVNMMPEDHIPHGFGTAASVMVHTVCLTPQPGPIWVELVAKAQRLAALAGYSDEPDRNRVEEAAHALRTVLEDALASLGPEPPLADFTRTGEAVKDRKRTTSDADLDARLTEALTDIAQSGGDEEDIAWTREASPRSSPEEQD